VQWSWYNTPQDFRQSHWPNNPKLPVQGLDPNSPKTQFKEIKTHKSLSYVTGEIYLLVNITKIGGLEHKLIGAKMAGVRLVLISKENEEDIVDIKKDFKDIFNDNFKYKIVEKIEDAVDEFLL
jgi:ATP-dependent Lon protease